VGGRVEEGFKVSKFQGNPAPEEPNRLEIAR
jgi:hypothetical protein